MTELHAKKRELVGSFITWLESRLKIKPSKDRATGIDSLTGKSILQNYLGDYQKGEPHRTWDEFYDRLFQNRRRFGVVLADVKGELEAAYEQSLAVLLPIKEQPDPEKALAEMAERLRAAEERLAGLLSMGAQRQELDLAVPGWRQYPEDVSRPLLTAEHQLSVAIEESDFSGTVVEYSKAVETAIYHRIFLRFRGESGCGPDDVVNEEAFKPFMARPDKKITLGSFSILLSSKEQALGKFVRRIYPRAAETITGRTTWSRC